MRLVLQCSPFHVFIMDSCIFVFSAVDRNGTSKMFVELTFCLFV